MKTDLPGVLAALRRAALPGLSDLDDLSPTSATESLGETPLHIAAIWGRVDYAAALLDAGAPIDARGDGGYTPLLEAIAQGHTDMVRFLLSRGADPSLRCEEGSAFDVAELAGRPEVLELVFKKPSS